MRDWLVPYDDKISSDVTCPIAMGALRYDKSSWVQDAVNRHISGYRPVLVGGLQNLGGLSTGILEAVNLRPQIRFGLFTHTSELLKSEIPAAIRMHVDEVFVAVDSPIDPADAKLLTDRYRPRWILIPRLGLNWKKLLAESLFPNKSGIVTLLAPEPNGPDGPFISCDEIFLNVKELLIEHPLIEVRPAQHEWFVPTEVKPWKMKQRDRAEVRLEMGGQDRSTFIKAGIETVSFIIPFLWDGGSNSLSYLKRCLESCHKVTDQIYSMTDSICTEFIVVVDIALKAPELIVSEFVNSLDSRIAQNLTWLTTSRVSQSRDWRAGWVRNVGVNYSRANSSSYLVFLDADCTITDKKLVAEQIVQGKNSLIFSSILDSREMPEKARESLPFEHASSRLMIVRRVLFEKLGGFADAFQDYGCEDNFFVWQSGEFHRRGLPFAQTAFPVSTTKHLRKKSDRDHLVAKMVRMRQSASLAYRMSLDARIHRHFFVSLSANESSVLWRYVVKQFAVKPLLRLALAPMVFLLTIFQTENVGNYLRGIADAIAWKFRAPTMRIVSHSWRLSYGIKWPGRKLRQLMGHLKVAKDRFLISAKSSRWGWNAVGWRTSSYLRRMWGECVRIGTLSAVFTSKWIVLPLLHYARQLPWLARVGIGRVVGTLLRVWGHIWTVLIIPYHFARLHSWRVVAFALIVPRWISRNFWRVPEFFRKTWGAKWRIKVFLIKVWGERWRIRVLYGRLVARLWFIPVAIERLRNKLRFSKQEKDS